MEDMVYCQAVQRSTTALMIGKAGTFVPMEDLIGTNFGVVVHKDGELILANKGLYQLSYTVTIDSFGEEAYVESCLYLQGLGNLPATKQVLMQHENISTMGNTTLANLDQNCTLRLLVAVSKDKKASVSSASSKTAITGLNVTASITVLQLS